MDNKLVAELISIIECIRLKITPDTDLMWTYHKSVPELLAEIDHNISRLKSEDMATAIRFFEREFAPTGTYQEIAMAHDWTAEYMRWSTRFDQLCEQLT